MSGHHGRIAEWRRAQAEEITRTRRPDLWHALCDRLGVDNSGRTLHGALLDAELLADVYINMTRGQDALLIEVSDSTGEGGVVEAIDLSRLDLPVLLANEQEAQAHQTVLAELDKSSKGKTVWRRLEAAASA